MLPSPGARMPGLGLRALGGWRCGAWARAGALGQAAGTAGAVDADAPSMSPVTSVAAKAESDVGLCVYVCVVSLRVRL